MTNCVRCGGHVDEARPVVIGSTSETKEVPELGQKSRDPASVTSWDTIVETKPEVVTVCKKCHDPKEDQYPTSDLYRVRRR